MKELDGPIRPHVEFVLSHGNHELETGRVSVNSGLGNVLDLGRNTGAPIQLVANGVLVAYGEVVAVGDSLGIRVTKLAKS